MAQKFDENTPRESREVAFMGFVMPEAPRPMAKIKPEDRGDTNLAECAWGTMGGF